MAIKNKLGSWIRNEVIGGTTIAHRLVVAALFYLFVMGIMYLHLIVFPKPVLVGSVLPYTIYAPLEFSYTDTTLLGEIQGDMQGSAMYPEVRENVLAKYDNFVVELWELYSIVHPETMGAGEDGGSPADSAGEGMPAGSDTTETQPNIDLQISSLARKYEITDPKVVELLLSQERETLNGNLVFARELLDTRMKEEITPTKLRTLTQGVVSSMIGTSPQEVYNYFLRANFLPYEREPLSTEDREMAMKTIHKGSVIVAEGQVVTQDIKDQLDTIKSHLVEQRLRTLAGIGLFLLIGLLIWHAYLSRQNMQIYADTSVLIQIAGLFVIFLLIGLVIGRLPFNYFYYGVTFAASALAAVIVMAFDNHLSVYLGIVMAALLSMGLNFEGNLLLYTLCGSILPSVVLSADCKRQTQVAFAFLLGILNALLALLVIAITVETQQWPIYPIAFLSGVLAAFFAFGLLPLVELFNSQVTPTKLFELANQENELLKRLKHEAPGTWMHSQMVAELTEEACKAIGADDLLAKVGALYHDIGKTKRSGFFAENITDLTKNPHEGLPAETSARIIKDHVTDGLALAEDARLPGRLLPFIREHHGTYLIRYFYDKAQKAHEQDPEKFPEPDERKFRYDGPVPQSRESGVLMLADVTEAVIRARGTHEIEEVTAIINSVITQKIEEKQLVDSGLTLGDLEKIREIFVALMSAQRHQRVSYPEYERNKVSFH
ncbi:HDIG domain-containing protein [bacterium]|nr:HDIG domain-containing protein [bacterium]UNM07702.1 MAG: HDIG domain-containing protein [Planctomycetales bacterium]